MLYVCLKKYIILQSFDSYYFTLLYKVQSFMIDQVLYVGLSIFVILKNFYIGLGELFIRKLSSKLQYQFYRLLCSSPSFKIQSIRLNQTIRTTFYMSRYDSLLFRHKHFLSYAHKIFILNINILIKSDNNATCI